MEDSELEPLASEITIRPVARAAKGLWSSRSVATGSKGVTPASAEIWSQGLKHTGSSKLVYSLLAEFRTANEEGRFVQALGSYREAANLSRTEKALKDATFDHALKEIKILTPNNWRVAAALLREASALDSSREMASNLGSDILRSEREETIANALAELKPGGDAEQSYTRVTRALANYPGDLSLESQLAGVCVAVVEKRGETERKRRLATMTSLRIDFERCTDPAHAAKLVALAQSALGPYRFDAEVCAIFAEMKAQAESCRKASAELAAGHVASCLQFCSQALHRTPQQQMLLELRRAAREFVYTEEAAAVQQVTELFEQGPLAEAQEVCRQARLRFSESSSLLKLDAAIHEKEANVRSLLETGEASLLARDVDTAGAAFLNAQSLLPRDPELGTHTATLLHNHARTEMDRDWRAFDSSLELLGRLQPDVSLPADLASVVLRRKQHAETVRLQAEAIHKIAERGLQADVLRDAAGVAPKTRAQGKLKQAKNAPEKATVTAETALVKANLVEISRPPKAPWLDKITIGVLCGVAATLVCATLLAWHDHQSRVARKAPPVVAVAETAKPLATKEGGVSEDSSETAGTQMATLEIRGAEPGTEVKVDNVLLGAAVPGNSLSRELSSGDHVVELSREGYTPKKMALHFAPGEIALLTGSNVQLQSTDATVLSAERRDWIAASRVSKAASLEDFVHKYPASAHVAEAKARIREAQWQSVDKTDPAALLAFSAKFPTHPAASQARELAQTLNRQSAARVEQADWQNLNKNNKAALATFLARYPNGAHVGNANALIADSDRSEAERMTAAKRPAEESHRPANVENSNAIARVDNPRREEHRLPVITPAVSDSSVVETAAVLDVIGRFASAWNAKDYRSLVEIEPDLNRRALKAQLSPVKAVTMRISPVAPPQIIGSQATVVCRRQADETFSDGSLRQNPESIVTYVLSKRNGSWGIEAIR